MEPFTPVTTAEQLEAFGIPAPMNRDKVLDVLEDVHREWIAATTLVFFATSSADGRCDVSPKGDPAGFVRVLGPTRLAIPEVRGTFAWTGSTTSSRTRTSGWSALSQAGDTHSASTAMPS